MKFLFDMFPLILFFGAYKWGSGHEEAAHSVVAQYLSGLISGGVVAASQSPLILATAVGIAATVIQIGYLLARGKKVDGMLWLSLVVIGVFGGATIYFHDDTFIKWKPTLIYWLFGLALLIGQVVFKKNLLRKGMEAQIKLPEEVWLKLVFAWIGFLAAMGALNLLIAFVIYKNDTGAWVSFKAFGATGLFLVFVIGQTLFLSKYIKEDA
ncbi:MAG: septation protein A [Burkholderiaceae bacterium]|nr:septation protein A [Burkholderiaceae bacterium]